MAMRAMARTIPDASLFFAAIIAATAAFADTLAWRVPDKEWGRVG
jgi:hypothetical protein